MRFYEFEAKRILDKHGIPVPQGGMASSAADARKIAADLGCPVAVKAQVIAPSLRKAGAAGSADTPEKAAEIAAKLLALDDGGRKVKGVLVEKSLPLAAQYSLALTYDGVAKLPVVAASDMPGNIDDIGDEHPDRVVKRHFSALFPFSDYQAKELAAALGLGGSDVNRLTGIVAALARLFLDYDLTQIDVTSLGKTKDGKFVVVDCEAEMEVEGRLRQKAICDELGISAKDVRAVREPTKFEIDGKRIDDEDPRGIVGPIVEFDGNIGLIIGAGGGSLTLTDMVKKHGGKPANYAAMGGNPSVGKAVALTKLVLGKPGVDKIAVMSNVVSNTRADLVARGVIKGVTEMGFKPSEKIVIFRVPGAWEADAFKILDKYGVEYCDRTVSMSEAARRAVKKIGG